MLAIVALGLTSCDRRYYDFPQYNFAGRPTPPSRLASRVMVSLTVNGTQGALQMIDSQRDIRHTIFDANSTFPISGYAAGYPNMIFNFPEQTSGYVYSNSDGSLTRINYSTEASAGPAGTLAPRSDSVAVPPGFRHIYAASSTSGVIVVVDSTNGQTYALNLPNVYRVAVNQGDSVILAMVRNSDTLYRLIRLNQNQPAVPGATDCQPFNVPVWCVVPVTDSSSSPSLDRPVGAYFSLDGTTAYVLNCGRECGGATSGITMLSQDALRVDSYPTSTPYPSPVKGNVAVPGGVTTALADGTTLYLAGQQLQPDGYFAGFLSTMDLNTNTVTGQYSISDGYHSKLLLGDDNTLWIGSQQCATGERAHNNQNYNCLTRYDIGAKTTRVLPEVSPGDPNSHVPYPNANENQYYYGDLTGLCWVQGLHKMYTAYGGQIHAFQTADGSEMDNSQITVQGTALDVAYMDAATNSAN